jgi:probable rRNA maturation factor
LTGIDFFFEDIQPFEVDVKLLKRHISSLIIKEKRTKGQITVIFCSDNYLLKMNQEYLQHDYYTDIITFNYSEGKKLSGDLFISVERVRENSDAFQTSFYKELYRVIFHGLLHLAGFDDKTTAEEQLMRKMEEFYLKGINFDSKQE